MANDLTENPHIIDTQNAALVFTGDIYIRKIRAINLAAAAGSQAIITDNAGRKIWETVVLGPNFVDPTASFGVNKIAVGGYKVPTLVAGITLYITVWRRWEVWVNE